MGTERQLEDKERQSLLGKESSLLNAHKLLEKNLLVNEFLTQNFIWRPL